MTMEADQPNQQNTLVLSSLETKWKNLCLDQFRTRKQEQHEHYLAWKRQQKELQQEQEAQQQQQEKAVEIQGETENGAETAVEASTTTPETVTATATETTTTANTSVVGENKALLAKPVFQKIHYDIVVVDQWWNTIVGRYLDSQRFYHNLNHLREMFQLFDQFSSSPSPSTSTSNNNNNNASSDDDSGDNIASVGGDKIPNDVMRRLVIQWSIFFHE